MGNNMGLWNYYFIAKLFLFAGRYIDFHVLPNLALAVFLVIPVRHPRLGLLRQVVAVPAGIVLFYHDTWLPPIARLFSQATVLQGFSLTYMMEILGRFISPVAIIGLVILFVAFYFTNKKFQKTTPFVFAAMFVPLMPIFPTPAPVKLSSVTFSADAAQSMPKSAEPTLSAGVTPTESAKSAMAKSEVSRVADEPVEKTEKTGKAVAKVAPGMEPAAPVVSHVSGLAAEAALTASLNAFHRQEGLRKVAFVSKSADAPFDIIFVQICSLSWDDLDIKKERNNALFKRFNIVFTNFNSAATYSGPAAIRLLRGSCGQQKHVNLYTPFSPQCLTFNNLRQIGFDTQLAMNHDGRFGGLLNDIRERGGMNAPLFDTRDSAPYLKSFDGSPIHNDFAVLSEWWKKRLQAPTARVALFYNGVSLHDGNRYADGRVGNSLETYHSRLTRLLGDVDRFISEIQASGRRAIVVFVPEHGAALRGDKMQIAGMREIPSPRISIVPVGIKLIGLPENPEMKPLVVSKPTSYAAISQLLAEFIRATPFGGSAQDIEKYVRDLPTTEFVAENDDVVVMRRGKQFFIRSRDAPWTEFDPLE